MKCLIFLFKIPKDNKDFFHGFKHDYEHHEIWHQQKMGIIHNLSKKKNGWYVIYWKKFLWRKRVTHIQFQKEFKSQMTYKCKKNVNLMKFV